MILIGVGNRAQSGKSLFCATIKEQCGRIGIKCGEYSFSAAILDYCIRDGLLPNLSRQELSDAQIEVLVRVGYEKRRGNEDFWVDQLHTKISSERPDIALIPNLRYENECRFVRDLQGHCVRVRRLNADGTTFISPCRDANHPSERALEFWPWDFEIRNMAGKPFWLRRQAVALFEYLRDGGE